MIDPGDPWEETDEMRSGGDEPPVRYVESGAWPDVVLRPDAPLSAYAGLILARRLATALEAVGWKANGVAVRAGLSAPAVRDIIHGKKAVTLPTLIRLEGALQARLYPTDLVNVSAVDLYGVDLEARFPTTEGLFPAGQPGS
ncbi:hypothetical protein [Embleya sp. MST-111070]|uniref:hypothetical protein n=1 Tax=Embleya sp. MST-111070 TaxID=3398231 RepID=UPI003F7326CD